MQEVGYLNCTQGIIKVQVMVQDYDIPIIPSPVAILIMHDWLLAMSTAHQVSFVML